MQKRQSAFLEDGELPPTLSELSRLKMDGKNLENLAIKIGQSENEKIAMCNLDVVFFYVRDAQMIRDSADLMPIIAGIEAARPSKNHSLDISAMAETITRIDTALARCPKYMAAQKKYGLLSPPTDLAACSFDVYLLACYVKHMH